MGPFRWLTVSSPEGAEGVELVLEPMGFAPAQTCQAALFAAGIPAFITNDIASEHRRLKERGVSMLTEADESSTGPASFMIVDPDGNTILVDQHV